MLAKPNACLMVTVLRHTGANQYPVCSLRAGLQVVRWCLLSSTKSLHAAVLIVCVCQEPFADRLALHLLQIFAGLLVGAMLPYWFSAMTMKSVGKAALAMVEEVRRQFNTIPGIMEGTARPDYRLCVEISTQVLLPCTLRSRATFHQMYLLHPR